MRQKLHHLVPPYPGAVSPTAVQIISFPPLAKWEPFMMTSGVTLKILFTWYIATVHQTVNKWTKRRLEDRFNEDRRPVDRPTPSSRPTAVSNHFISDNHPPNDIKLVPLELINSSRDVLRKARKAYLIGLNSWTQRYKHTRRNSILCLTHLQLMY